MADDRQAVVLDVPEDKPLPAAPGSAPDVVSGAAAAAVVVSPAGPEHFKRLALIQVAILAVDLCCTLFAETWRSTPLSVAIIYVFQALLIVLNTALLFVGFTDTFPFRAGLVGLVAREFSCAVAGVAAYFVAFVAVRAAGLAKIFSCESAAECDLWTPGYRFLYAAFRLSAIGYYVSFKRSAVQLCEPKYHKDSSWLRAKLRRR